MPRILHRALSPETCLGARPNPKKPVKLADGGGLYLVVHPSGSRAFTLRVQQGGKETWKHLGAFPKLTLAKARDAARTAMVETRQAPATATPATMTFAVAFETWFKEVKTPNVSSAAYAADIYERLAKNALPALGSKPIDSITRADTLAILKKIAGRGSHDQARRVRALLSELFDWAENLDLISRHPAPQSLLKFLPKKPRTEGHKAAAFVDMPTIMKRITLYPSPITSAAIRFTILTATRTSEVRGAKWAEIDFEQATWTVPAERMKGRREHVVPLCTQALALLNSLPKVTTTGLIFPTPRDDRQLSNMALLTALKAMGFPLTIHGFRATFSSWANDRRIADTDVVEAALAHTIKDAVKKAYDRGTRFDLRRGLMQSWADAIL